MLLARGDVKALMCLFSASQDIATDAVAVGLLEPKERGLGNAVQSVGGSLGGAIGGGGMLILLNNWGWRNSLLTLALIMIVTLIPVLLHREKVVSADLTRNVVNDLSMSFTDNSSTTSATKSVTKLRSCTYPYNPGFSQKQRNKATAFF